MSQNLTKLLQPILRLNLDFVKKSGHFEQPALSRTNRSFGLTDISNLPSYGKLTESTCLDSSRRSFVDMDGCTDRSVICREDQVQKISPTQCAQISLKSITQEKPNQIVPGIKFGRFFGAVEDATERVIGRRISQKQGRAVETKNNFQDQLTVIKQTLSILNKNSQSTQTQKYLLSKIEMLNNKLEKLSSEYPSLQQQNKELKKQNHVLQSSVLTNQSKAQWWERYATQKDIEVIRKMNSNFQNQMRMVNKSNCTNSRVSSRSTYIRADRNM